MEPENKGLEDEFPFQTGDFQVPCSISGVYFFQKVTPRNIHNIWGKNHISPPIRAGTFEDFRRIFPTSCWVGGEVITPSNA